MMPWEGQMVINLKSISLIRFEKLKYEILSVINTTTLKVCVLCNVKFYHCGTSTGAVDISFVLGQIQFLGVATYRRYYTSLHHNSLKRNGPARRKYYVQYTCIRVSKLTSAVIVLPKYK